MTLGNAQGARAATEASMRPRRKASDDATALVSTNGVITLQ